MASFIIINGVVSFCPVRVVFVSKGLPFVLPMRLAGTCAEFGMSMVEEALRSCIKSSQCLLRGYGL